MPHAKRLHALAEHLRTLAGSLDDRPCNILRYITRPSLGRVERDHSARMIELTGQEISHDHLLVGVGQVHFTKVADLPEPTFDDMDDGIAHVAASVPRLSIIY